MPANTDADSVLRTEAVALDRDLTRSLAALSEMSKPEHIPQGVFLWPLCETIARQDGELEGPTPGQGDLLDVFRRLTVTPAVRTRLPTAESIMARARDITASGRVPIAVAGVSFCTLAKAFTERVALGLKRGAAFEIPADFETLHEQRFFFGAAALLDPISDGIRILEPIYYGTSVSFLIAKDLILSNAAEGVESVDIDLDDGEGFRSIDVGSGVHVEYSEGGEKRIRLRANIGGKLRRAAFRFRVSRPKTEIGWTDWATISGSTYKDGKEYSAATRYKSVNGPPFSKPVLCASGFGGVYASVPNFCLPHGLNLLGGPDLYDELVTRGYDIIEVNFKLNGGYIQGNANVVIEAIKRILENSAFGASLVVIGGSMGGVVTHFALGKMETDGQVEPRIRAWLSFDSPQGGAVIPLGAQMFSLFFECQESTAKTQAARLRSPAAKQMLIYHVGDRYNKPGEHSLVSQERKDFVAELKRVGYPTTMRKLAVSDGRADGKGLGYQPHTRTLNWHGDMLVNAEIWGNADRSTNVETYMTAYCVKVDFWNRWTYGSRAARYYDGAPGGTGTFNGEVTAGANASGKGSVESAHHITNYIPSVSAADIPTSDPYFDISSGRLPSPFDATYFANSNRPHVEWTAEMIQWVVGELERSLA